MRLLFELPDCDKEVFEKEKIKGEAILYCIPFDFHEETRVKGFMVFTQKNIYKILDGKILEKHGFEGLSDFTVEVMLGVCGFYAKKDGVSFMLCSFISGRNLARYSVMAAACERIAEGNYKLLSSEEPESYCPKCGRPFIKPAPPPVR